MKSKIEKILWNCESTPESIRSWGVMIENKLNQIIDHLNSQDQEGENEVNKMYDFNERKITTYIVDEDKVITILRQDEMPEWLKKGDIRVFKDTPEDTEHIKAHKEYLATSKQDTTEKWDKNSNCYFNYVKGWNDCLEKAKQILGHLYIKEVKDTPEMSTNTAGLLPEEKRCQQSKDITEEWEKEFDKEFGEIGGVIDESNNFQLVAHMSENIKDFIKQLLEEKEKEKLVSCCCGAPVDLVNLVDDNGIPIKDEIGFLIRANCSKCKRFCQIMWKLDNLNNKKK